MDPLLAVVVAVLGYIVFLLSSVLHELGHNLAARLIGARESLQHPEITLSPLPFMKNARFGLGIMPLISMFANMRIGGVWTFGYSGVPFHPEWAVKNRTRAAWIAFGGPAANFLVALAAGFLIKAGCGNGWFAYDFSGTPWLLAKSTDPTWDAAATLLSMLFYQNILMAVFNLMPMPPLDGFSLMLFWLKPERALALYSWETKLSFIYPLAVYHATALFWVVMSRMYILSLALF